MNIARPNPRWETVLDIDALAKARTRTGSGADKSPCLAPDDDRCLIFLSRGGGDTKVVREFDLVKKEFVADGFILPAAKSDIAWRDRDSVYVGTDFGPDSLTSSGYARIAKLWRRGRAAVRRPNGLRRQAGGRRRLGLDERRSRR